MTVYQTLRAGNWKCTLGDFSEIGLIKRLISPPSCIVVRAHSVVDDLLGDAIRADGECRWSDITAAVPPFPVMWYEFILPPGRPTGVLLTRASALEALPMIGVELAQRFWLRSRGFEPFVVAAAQVFTSTGGFVLGPMCTIWFAISEFGECEPMLMVGDDDSARQFSQLAAYIALQGCARLACANVRMERIAEPKIRGRKHSELLACVWHEIKVIEDVRRSGNAVLPPEDVDGAKCVRAHWVRGHFADFRRGRGAFGRVRAIFWIPEHRRGNEDLGEVIPEYVLLRPGND